MFYGLVVYGYGLEVFSFFWKFEIEGIMFNGIIFVVVLFVCCYGSFFEEGYEIFYFMKMCYNFEF